MEEPARVAEAQHLQTGLLLDVRRELGAEGAVEDVVGGADVGEGEGHVDDTHHRVDRGESADRVDAGLDDAGFHL